MTIHGNTLLTAFRTIHRNNSRQIGKFFCIPASISNALRLCRCNTINQYRIRDLYYQNINQPIPQDIDNQMIGCSFDIIKVLANDPDFSNSCKVVRFELPGDTNPFDVTKSQRAVDFLTNHLRQSHPVIVSTYFIPWWLGILQAQCCHMWLCLAYDDALQSVVFHDSGTDQIESIPIQNSVTLSINGNVMALEIGLRGRITHTDYSCLAFEPVNHP